MKICYIAPGTSIHTRRWANYFAKKGHDVHVISWSFVDGYYSRIKIHKLFRCPPNNWKVSMYLSGVVGLYQVMKILKRVQPDILDVHYITIHGYMAALINYRPFIVSAWGSDVLITPRESKIHAYLTGFALRKSDAVICLSHTLKPYLVDLGAEEDKINVILLGVDTNKFVPSRDVSGLRKTLGIPECDPVIISTRNLSPVYNVETLVKAIPLVLKEIPRARFLVAGCGEDSKKLRQLVRELHVSDNVSFLGHIQFDDVPKWLGISDIYVSTSLSDGASNSLLEAMACSLVPVVTDIPANRPWVRNGENGYLFDAKDFRGLSLIIVELISNKALRYSYGQRCRKLVSDVAEHHKEMEKAEQMYGDLSRR